MEVSGEGAPKIDSAITTVSPKVGFNFVPLLGDQRAFSLLGFGYASDFAVYEADAAESFDAHRFATTLKGKTDAFSFSVDNGLNYIDGDRVAPIYAGPDAVRSAYATSAARERREQIQDRAKITFQYDWQHWFIRPTATLLYYDLMTELRAIPGYQNYADRYDVNGGADVGYKLNPQWALMLGYRYGHQYQQQFPLAIDFLKLSSPSDYQRVLAGLEAEPFKWLTVALLGGPDFRSYAPNTASHTTPVNDLNLLTYYGEAIVAAAMTKADSLTFKYKQWQWVASTGKLPYFDSSYDLTYTRVVTKKLGLTLGARLLEADYTSGNQPSSLRNDIQYTIAIGVRYSFNANLSADLGFATDLGRNAQPNVVDPQYREFNHSLISLGAQIKF